MSHPIAVTDATFQEEVLDSKLPVLVDFWAAWCHPCLAVAPVVEALADDNAGRLKVVKVDIDANPATPNALNILSVPALIVFRDGKPVDRVVGYQPKKVLQGRIDAALAP